MRLVKGGKMSYCKNCGVDTTFTDDVCSTCEYESKRDANTLQMKEKLEMLVVKLKQRYTDATINGIVERGTEKCRIEIKFPEMEYQKSIFVGQYYDVYDGEKDKIKYPEINVRDHSDEFIEKLKILVKEHGTIVKVPNWIIKANGICKLSVNDVFDSFVEWVEKWKDDPAMYNLAIHDIPSLFEME